jgi:hypothetical protein
MGGNIERELSLTKAFAGEGQHARHNSIFIENYLFLGPGRVWHGTGRAVRREESYWREHLEM